MTSWRTLDRLEVVRPSWLVDRVRDDRAPSAWRRRVRSLLAKVRPS